MAVRWVAQAEAVANPAALVALKAERMVGGSLAEGTAGAAREAAREMAERAGVWVEGARAEEEKVAAGWDRASLADTSAAG